LKYAEVPIISAENCATDKNDYDIFDGMICAGCKEGGRDSCQVGNTKHGPPGFNLSPFYHSITKEIKT
jgi:hypothetical protein